MNDSVLAKLKLEDWQWRADCINELRALGVAGSKIGTALNETDQFCQDSGEWHQKTFGDPAEYARGLGLSPDEIKLWTSMVNAMPLTLQILGFWILFPSALNLLSPGKVTVQWFWLLIPVTYFVATLINGDYFKQKRLRVAKIWIKAAAFVVIIVAIIVIGAQLSQDPRSSIQAPASLLLALGLALGLAGSVWAQFGLAPIEPVYSPHDTPKEYLTAELGKQWQTRLRNWGFTAASLIFLAICAVFLWRY